jgi:hypothetical protein
MVGRFCMFRAGEAAAAGGQAARAVRFRTDEGTLRRVRDALAAGGSRTPDHEYLIGPAEELDERRSAAWLPRVRPDLAGPWW